MRLATWAPTSQTNLPATRLSPEAELAREEMNQLVREHLPALPDKYRLPLVYASIEGLDYETIGSALRVQPGSVKTLVFRARQMLKARIVAALGQRRRT
jgi:RNA polymerase sigma-70 factor (ECF subfamily)